MEIIVSSNDTQITFCHGNTRIPIEYKPLQAPLFATIGMTRSLINIVWEYWIEDVDFPRMISNKRLVNTFSQEEIVHMVRYWWTNFSRHGMHRDSTSGYSPYRHNLCCASRCAFLCANMHIATSIFHLKDFYWAVPNHYGSSTVEEYKAVQNKSNVDFQFQVLQDACVWQNKELSRFSVRFICGFPYYKYKLLRESLYLYNNALLRWIENDLMEQFPKNWFLVDTERRMLVFLSAKSKHAFFRQRERIKFKGPEFPHCTRYTPGAVNQFKKQWLPRVDSKFERLKRIDDNTYEIENISR